MNHLALGVYHNVSSWTDWWSGTLDPIFFIRLLQLYRGSHQRGLLCLCVWLNAIQKYIFIFQKENLRLMEAKTCSQHYGVSQENMCIQTSEFIIVSYTVSTVVKLPRQVKVFLIKIVSKLGFIFQFLSWFTIWMTV